MGCVGACGHCMLGENLCLLLFHCLGDIFLPSIGEHYLVFCYLEGNDDTEFNRRIIAMPFIMPLIIFLQYIRIAMFISFRRNFNQSHHPIDFVTTGSQNDHGDTE